MESSNFNYTNDRYSEIFKDSNNNNEINLINDYHIDKEYDSGNKLQELLDNQKILNTLRSIKSTNSYEEVKNLPQLFLDIQEALKKSNSNVLELKETINELILKENKLKNKLKEVLQENEYLKSSHNKSQINEMDLKNRLDQSKVENINLNKNINLFNDINRKYEEVLKENKIFKKENDNLGRKKEMLIEEVENKQKEIDSLEQNIQNIKKNYLDIQLKNKQYKTNQGILKQGLSNIEEKLDEINIFKQEIKELQSETSLLRKTVQELEDERKTYLSKENNFKSEIKILQTNNKKIKSDLKNELNEKINILKELDKLKTNQKVFYDKHENLKNIVENTTNVTEKMNQTKQNLENKLMNVIEEAHNYEIKYKEIENDFNQIVNENKLLREELNEKKFSDQEVYKITDKYEEEIFNLKCELNVWKQSFIEIAKYKLMNYDDSNSDDLVGLDKNYIYNAPHEIKEKSEGVIIYFKTLIEEENYQTINLKSLKEALVNEQEKSLTLKEQLINELKLRRKIHNRYMLIRGNLRVMLRVRPFIQSENTSLIKKSYLDTFKFTNESVNINENSRKKNFDFDYIFNQKSNQSEVYEEVSLLVQSMLQGNNICIIAYGQTCTGKTYTISGPDKNHPGIAVRSAKEIFELLNENLKEYNNDNNNNISSKLSLSIIEIYNENIYNLLNDNQPLLNIYENNSGNLVIPDLNPIKINNFNEAAKLFTLSSKLRHTNSTQYNDRSSRSHCIYSFHLKIVIDNKIIRSKLHIIDLAGSERIGRSPKVEDELTKKEAIFINLSLLSLSNVLNAIAMKQNHIPYRDSKLTHFLKESLNENFNILLLLHVSPNIRDIGESVSTMDFGTRIVKICKHKTGKEKLINILGK